MTDAMGHTANIIFPVKLTTMHVWNMINKDSK